MGGITTLARIVEILADTGDLLVEVLIEGAAGSFST
jgi:hypothetical protein